MIDNKIMNMKRLFPWITIIFIFLFASCQTVRIKDNIPGDFSYAKDWCPADLHWEPVREGIECTYFYIPELQVTWHCVRIDMDCENLHFLTVLNVKNGKFEGFKLKNSAKTGEFAVLLNSTPFKKDFTPVGIIVDKKDVLSQPVDRYAALGIGNNADGKRRAFILDSQDEIDGKDFDLVHGGFFTILDGNEIFEFKKTRRSRAACGIKDEGKFLYLFAATPRFSLSDNGGLTYEECAFILKQMGCTKAMQFDGGRSTGLYIGKEKKESAVIKRNISAALGITTKD